MNPPDRRQFIRTSVQLVTSATLTPLVSSPLLAQTPSADPAATKPAPKSAPPPKPPRLSDDQVQAIVGQAHRSLDKVRALLEATPTLANAVWDWGGGDFETPLEAAAHTGGREIAELLLAHGARFDLYAAAMLGQLDRVQSALGRDVVSAAAVPGPHGFTLLHCAKQGGPGAKPVYDWLRAHGVPEVFMLPLPYKWPASATESPKRVP